MRIDPIVGWDQYQECEILGAFYSAPKIREISVRNQIWFSTTGLFGTTFEGGQLWPVHSFRSVRPKCSFLFDKIVVPSTALLHPAYKNNTQMCGGLGSGQCIWNLPFHWARGVPKISNWNFYWTESIPSVSFCTELLSLPPSQLAITLQLG